MPRNFYVVLGISRDANPAQIRKAHRRMVKLHHPDTGTGSVDRFAEVQQAYETLSDEEARRVYDESLGPGSRSSPPRAEPQTTDLRPGRRSRPIAPRHEPVSIQEAAPGLFGAVDEFLDGWLPGFFTKGPTASRRKDLYVELILEPEEAARGGLFPLHIPVRERCDHCEATGYTGVFVCRVCRGSGVVTGEREAEISIPAGVADGTEARLSLEDIGLKGVDLNVFVSVRS